MKPDLEKLKTYIENHPIRFDDDCGFPALDSLYWHYSSCHPMTSGKAKQASANLNACLKALSWEDNDRLFSHVNALCAEHKRIAFLAGLRLGAQLILELQREEE